MKLYKSVDVVKCYGAEANSCNWYDTRGMEFNLTLTTNYQITQLHYCSLCASFRHKCRSKLCAAHRPMGCYRVVTKSSHLRVYFCVEMLGDNYLRCSTNSPNKYFLKKYISEWISLCILVKVNPKSGINSTKRGILFISRLIRPDLPVSSYSIFLLFYSDSSKWSFIYKTPRKMGVPKYAWIMLVLLHLSTIPPSIHPAEQVCLFLSSSVL